MLLSLLFSYHLMTPELNKFHGVLEIKDTVAIYNNSFNKPSVALYKKFTDGNISLRIGVTTGYNRIDNYKGREYETKSVFQDNLGLFLVPSYETDKYVIALLGPAICFGVKF